MPILQKIRKTWKSKKSLQEDSAGVKENSVLGRRGEDDGDVCVRLHCQWLHLDVGRVVREAHAREIFATLS